MTAPPAAPRLQAPFTFGARATTPLVFSIPATGQSAADVLRDRPARGADARGEHRDHLGQRCQPPGPIPSWSRSTNAAGSATATYTLVSGNTLALTPPDGLEQLRLVRRQRHRAGHDRPGAGGEDVPAAVRLEHRRHRLSLVRTRPADRRQRPLSARDQQVSVGDGQQRIQDAGRSDPRHRPQLRHPHHARRAAQVVRREQHHRGLDVHDARRGQLQRSVSLGHAYVGRARRHGGGAGLVRLALRSSTRRGASTTSRSTTC